MYNKIKTWIEIALSVSFSFIAKILDNLKLDWLQKIFYLLSIALLLTALIKLLRGNKLGAEKITKASSVAEQALNPEIKAEKLVSNINKIKIGGNKLMNKIKALGWVKIASIVLTLFLIILGVLSVFVPGLEVVANNFETLLVAIGIVVSPGLVAQGKKIGNDFKKQKKKELKELKAELKQMFKERLDVVNYYSFLDEPMLRLAEYGGSLTDNEKDAKANYDLYLKKIDLKIEDLKNKIEEVEQNV